MAHPNFIERTVCPGCNSGRISQIYSALLSESPVRDYLDALYSPQGGIEYEYLNGAMLVLCRCDDCSLVFQRDIGNDTLLERLYDHWIDSSKQVAIYETDRGLRHYQWLAEQIILLGFYFGDRTPGRIRVLDFGMGWGDWCKMAQAFGFAAFGAELSKIRIENARRSGISILEWDQIPGAELDMINSEQVFEHLAHPLDTLKHFRSGLRAGGLIRLNVPDGSDIDRRLSVMDWKAAKWTPDSLNCISPLEHINCFNRQSMIAMGKQAGLEPVKIRASLKLASLTGWHPGREGVRNLARFLFLDRRRNQTEIYFRAVS